MHAYIHTYIHTYIRTCLIRARRAVRPRTGEGWPRKSPRPVINDNNHNDNKLVTIIDVVIQILLLIIIIILITIITLIIIIIVVLRLSLEVPHVQRQWIHTRLQIPARRQVLSRDCVGELSNLAEEISHMVASLVVFAASLRSVGL